MLLRAPTAFLSQLASSTPQLVPSGGPNGPPAMVGAAAVPGFGEWSDPDRAGIGSIAGLINASAQTIGASTNLTGMFLRISPAQLAAVVRAMGLSTAGLPAQNFDMNQFCATDIQPPFTAVFEALGWTAFTPTPSTSGPVPVLTG